ncbi:MAG: NADH-quinone oxidoreductase subunit C [Planctomycetota bacterium]
MPTLDHPVLPAVKAAFPDAELFATEFRGETTLVVPKDTLHDVLQFLKDAPDAKFDFLSDIVGIDYLNYPKPKAGPSGRFAVVYNLESTTQHLRLFVKVLLDPTLDTAGVEDDPALHLPTCTDLWPGAEWMEREVFDMFGVRFDGHPDLRRILTWESYPAHPQRKDYPVKGRGEREDYRVVERDDA